MKSARAVRMQASSSDLAKPDARIVWPARFTPVLSPVFAQNTIDIAASPEAVWRLLIDCVAWPHWYRHCSDVSILRGKPRLGPGSQFRFKTLGRYFEPEIVTFDPFTMLLWQARGPAGTRGAHAWYIERTPDGCRVVTEETQRGAVLFLVRSRARSALLTAHEEWLRALKRLAEKS